MKKKCEIEDCNREAVEKYGKKWLCREHLCPEPEEEYIEMERLGWCGLKSNSIGFETTVLEYIEIEKAEENWYVYPVNAKKEKKKGKEKEKECQKTQ